MNKIHNVLLNIGAEFINYNVLGDNDDFVNLVDHPKWELIKEQIDKFTQDDLVNTPGLITFLAHLEKVQVESSIPSGYADSSHLRSIDGFKHVYELYNKLLDLTE